MGFIYYKEYGIQKKKCLNPQEVRELRINKGYTIDDLANKYGVTYNAMSKYLKTWKIEVPKVYKETKVDDVPKIELLLKYLETIFSPNMKVEKQDNTYLINNRWELVWIDGFDYGKKIIKDTKGNAADIQIYQDEYLNYKVFNSCICQYDEYGLVRIWKSVSDIARHFNDTRYMLDKCIDTNITVYGYKFIKYDDINKVDINRR